MTLYPTVPNWMVYKHGRSKSRTWRKLHTAVDIQTLQIVATEKTSNSRVDASVVIELLTHIDDIFVSLCTTARMTNEVFTPKPHVMESTL